MKDPVDLRMDAYYYGFTDQKSPELQLVLSAVACAGKAFHHTEDWNDAASPYEGHEGVTPIEWIERAAEKADTALVETRDRLHAANNALTIAQIALRRISASDTASDIDGNHEGKCARIAHEALAAIENAIRT